MVLKNEPASAWGGGRAPSAPKESGWSGASAGQTRTDAPLPESDLSARGRLGLREEYLRTIRAGIHGLCFSPYTKDQAPGSTVTPDQIRARLSIVRPYTHWIRTFSCTDGHEHTPRIAHELGLKTLVGAWLGKDLEVNEREIAGAIAAGRDGHADLLAIGNEVLLREDLTEDQLLGYIQRVKHAVPGVPVGYVDAYYLFELHPRIAAACDVLMTNCYPYWEGCPREHAVAYMQDMYRRTRAVAGGKRVIVTETGWPHIGSAFHGSVPSVDNAMRYFVDTCRWGAEDEVEIFYFAAFDEAWKVGAEGDVGAYWGLWDTDGALKYAQ